MMIYENETTQSAPSKEEVLFELREMADVLPHWAESNRDTLLMQMIRDILYTLISLTVSARIEVESFMQRDLVSTA